MGSNPSNWTEENGGGWLGCPHCDSDLCEIHLSRTVRGDWPFGEGIVAEPGLYIASFNPQGAASVIASNGKWLGIKPGEFRWTRPVPPYDRWCKGAGGLHQEVRRGS